MADHVAVADDVGGHDRRVGGERLGQHHAEALAAQRRRHQQVGLAQQAPLLLVADAAGHVHALGVHQDRLDLFPGGAGHGQARGHAGAAQGLEGAQQHGQALAVVGAAHEQQLERVGAAVVGPGGGQVHAVGDDAVAAAVVALGRPLGGLGHGQADAELVVQPTDAHHVGGEAVGQRARGVAVEGAHQGHARELGGEEAHEGHVGLVHVDHVVAAVAQLASQRSDRLGRDPQVRDRPVGGEARGAPQRDQVLGHGAAIRLRAAMHYTSQAVVRVVRGQDPDIVSLG